MATSDEILSALAHADELLERGQSLAEICHTLGICEQTYRIWRRAHSRTFLATGRRVQALEDVNAKLLALVVDQQSEIRQLRARVRSTGP